MEEISRCERCGDVIGVYEAVVVVREDGTALTSSYAAEPRLARGRGEHYHHACYAALGPSDGAGEGRM